MSSRLLIRLVVAATSLYASTAMAGPPMVTDDTGTAAPGVLEIIAFAAGESRDAGKSMQGPALDLAYGMSDTVEFSLTIPRQQVKDAGEATNRGWGEASVGMKWRFVEDDTSALALAPSLSMPLSSSSTIIGLVEDTTVFTLPLLASVNLGPWELTGNLGYSIGSRNLDAVSVGASAGYSLTPRIRLLGETWGIDFVDDGASEGFLNWRLGMEWGLTESLTLLAAYGGSIWSQLDEADELNEDYFLGLQYALGD